MRQVYRWSNEPVGQDPIFTVSVSLIPVHDNHIYWHKPIVIANVVYTDPVSATCVSERAMGAKWLKNALFLYSMLIRGTENINTIIRMHNVSYMDINIIR